jgi:predicted nucleic acid-binding protein
MRVLIDTNIFLDMLQRRENYISAKRIISLVDDNFFKFFVADITLINIDYVAKKQISDIREFLEYINDNFTVLGANNSSFKNALNIDNKDLEDNLQYCLALEQACDYIVTNDKNFLKKDTKIMSSEEFVLKYVN